MSFSEAIQKAADGQRQMMLMQRSIVNGVISERDRLLNYTVGEFFTEMSLFIDEVERKNKEYDKLKK